MSPSDSYEKYYENQLKAGNLFQDFVVDCCWNLLGLAVVQYTSKVYQRDVGESKTGVEIKLNDKYTDTGNLWIEVSEKASIRPGPYVESGIHRDDNTWLFITGTYDVVFIFFKKFLQQLHASNRYRILESNTKTSEGFLLPHKDAVKYAGQILYPNAMEKIGKVTKDLRDEGKILHEICQRDPGNQLDLFQKY